MKKLALRLAIALVVILILVFVALGLFLDSAVKRAVETIGPRLAKVEIKLDAVSLSLFSGGGKVKGMVVGNPEGYKTPSAMSVGLASLTLSPGSLLSDKIVIKSINVQAPEITFETDLKHNNLSQILSNLEAATGGGGDKPAPAPKEQAPKDKPSKPAKKLEVDDFLISDGKIHISATLLGGQSLTVPLPTIHLTDLGKDADGITAAELMKRVITEIEKAAAEAAKGAASGIGKAAGDLTKGAEKTATEKITKGLGDLLKKKN
jgi:uncharacterized protein involved in outer membrane biogenesis